MIGGLNLLRGSNKMQPYQKASQANRISGEGPIRMAKNVGLTAAGGAIGKFGSMAAGALLSRIKPLLSEYVPDNLMEKGLEKIDPRFGKFINGAKKEGFDPEEIRSFINEKTEPPKEIRSIIEQYSPELQQFLDQEIKNGRDVLQAGAIAQNDKRFMKIIDKIQKDHKTPWSAILQSVFGGGKGQETQMPEQGVAMKELLVQGGNPFSQQGQQQQPQQGGQGPIGNRLQQALQLLKQSRGG